MIFQNNTITCLVTEDKITPEVDPFVYHNNTKFLKVKFTSDWRSYRTVAAFFVKDNEVAMPIEHGRCQIPKEALDSGYFRVSVSGLYRDGTIKQTNKLLAIKEG